MIDTPICIVGAGPSGATASMFLSQRGIHHILLDKATFPRDKVCGDGLTLEVMHQLQLIDPSIVGEMQTASAEFLPSWGAKAYAPNGRFIHLDFDPSQLPYAPFFTAKRLDFDRFLHKHVPSAYVDMRMQANVVDMVRENGKVILTIAQEGNRFQVRTPLVFGADGERSMVGRKLGEGNKKPLSHTYASVRAYFDGVTGMGPKNELEFIFLEELLPGYFWIFPMPNGGANVGLIMLSEQVSKQKINLRKRFAALIAEHPKLAPRFKNANMDGQLKGWGLPLSSNKKTLAGDNYFLLGDAGALIEPFTGKGIGIGMISGKIAAEFAAEALAQHRFDAEVLMAYSDAVYRRYNSEWQWLYRFQRLFSQPSRVNAIVNIYNIPFVKNTAMKRLQGWVKRWMKPVTPA